MKTVKIQNCDCEFEEEVNPIQSGVRIHKLVKQCKECKAKREQAQEQERLRKIDVLNEQIKLLEVDIQSAKTLGYQDVVKIKQDLRDNFISQVGSLMIVTETKPEVEAVPIVEEKSKKAKKKKDNVQKLA